MFFYSGQMNEPPGARARVALTGLTVAEYFRDQEGQDVLLFIDNIFRFTQVSPFSRPKKKLQLFGKNLQLFLENLQLFCNRPVLRYLPFWVVSHPLSVTSQPWPLTWVKCRKELQQPKRVPLHLSRPFMYQLMT